MTKIKELVNELLHVTEYAAIACHKWIGMGQKNEADEAAVTAMRKQLNKINFNAKVVIGEGERDKAPMLFIGEQVGADHSANVHFDLAVDPLEGTNLCAHCADGAIAVLAITESGGFLHAPDVYMEKIAVPAIVSEGVVNLKNSTLVNLHNVMDDVGCSASDILVTILDRPRHKEMIKEVRGMGARVKLITDGDVNAVISTALENNYLNIYMGTGGAPEGVLAAAALKTLGGYMEGKLLFHDSQKERANKSMNIKDFNKIYSMHEMASKECAFIATGVTTGRYLEGVSISEGNVSTNSMLLTSWDKCVNYTDKTHNL